MTTETSPKQTLWQQFLAACSSPLAAIRNKSKDSPFITIVAVAFLAQPLVSTTIAIVQEIVSVHQEFDPDARPVTKAEFDLVNKKIDFNNQLIGQMLANQKPDDLEPVVVTAPYNQLQNKLTNVQKKLDSAYKAKK